MLFHFCHFSEVIYCDLKKIVTDDVCINQRTNNDLGGSRLAGVPPQPIRVPKKLLLSPELDVGVCMCVCVCVLWGKD